MKRSIDSHRADVASHSGMTEVSLSDESSSDLDLIKCTEPETKKAKTSSTPPEQRHRPGPKEARGKIRAHLLALALESKLVLKANENSSNEGDVLKASESSNANEGDVLKGSESSSNEGDVLKAKESSNANEGDVLKGSGSSSHEDDMLKASASNGSSNSSSNKKNKKSELDFETICHDTYYYSSCCGCKDCLG